MFYDFDEYIKYLGEKVMTPNQFALCWMIHFNDIKNMKMYTQKVGGFSLEEFRDLIERDFILSANPRETDLSKLDIAQMVVTPKFSDNILIDEETAFKQLLDVYIKKIEVNGTFYSATSGDMYKLESFYFNTVIKGNKLKHDYIIEETKKVVALMKQKVIGSMGIEKYVRGRNWELANKLKDDRGSTDMW